jgi:hypothetical protein
MRYDTERTSGEGIRRALTVVAAIIIPVALLSGATAIGDPPHPIARDAHTLIATDTAHMHHVDGKNTLIVEEGPASGTIPGRVKAYISVGATITATFTIFAKSGGSVSGRGSGELKGRPSEPSFGGTFIVTGGTGRYAHARGTGKLYGALDRKTLAMTVMTTGRFSY